MIPPEQGPKTSEAPPPSWIAPPGAKPPSGTRPDLKAPLPSSKAQPIRWLPVLLAVLAVTLVYVSFQWAIGALVHSRPVVSVPDLNGKSVADALNLISQSHLGLTKEGEQFDKRFPAGMILQQNPAAGMMVREGHMIKITLSQGGETLFVPALAGQPFRNAQTLLQNVGLGVGEVEHRPSLRFEKDQVMATDPPSGAVVGKNGLVNIVLSQGPPGSDVVLIPDFVGKNLSKAKSWAAERQVAITVKEESDINKGSGEILMQSPAGDSPFHSGDSLTVVVNTAMGSSDGPHVRYDVPLGPSERDVRILVIDEGGEREIYRRAQAPGSRIDFPVTVKGRARARILVNGILVEEQDLQ